VAGYIRSHIKFIKCINCHAQHENLVTFLDFRLSQGSVATYCRLGGNLCDVYIENFLTNLLVKEFWKSVRSCQSYYKTSRGLVFLEHGVCFMPSMHWYYSDKSTPMISLSASRLTWRTAVCINVFYCYRLCPKNCLTGFFEHDRRFLVCLFYLLHIS